MAEMLGPGNTKPDFLTSLSVHLDVLAEPVPGLQSDLPGTCGRQNNDSPKTSSSLEPVGVNFQRQATFCRCD